MAKLIACDNARKARETSGEEESALDGGAL